MMVQALLLAQAVYRITSVFKSFANFIDMQLHQMISQSASEGCIRGILIVRTLWHQISARCYSAFLHQTVLKNAFVGILSGDTVRGATILVISPRKQFVLTIRMLCVLDQSTRPVFHSFERLCTGKQQCCLFSRNIAQVTPKAIYFHYQFFYNRSIVSNKIKLYFDLNNTGKQSWMTVQAVLLAR